MDSQLALPFLVSTRTATRIVVGRPPASPILAGYDRTRDGAPWQLTADAPRRTFSTLDR